MNQWPPYEHYGPLAPAPPGFFPLAPAGYGPAPSTPARPPSRGTAYTAAVLALLLALAQLLALALHASMFIAEDSGDFAAKPNGVGLAISLLVFAGLVAGAVLLLRRRPAGSPVLTLTISGGIVMKALLISYVQVNHDEKSWFYGVRKLMWLSGIDLTGVVVIGLLVCTLALLPATQRWCTADPQPAWDTPPFGAPGHPAAQQPYYGP